MISQVNCFCSSDIARSTVALDSDSIYMAINLYNDTIGKERKQEITETLLLFN